jgi:hypothetical protein
MLMVLLNSDPKIPSVGKIETHHPHFKSKPKITQTKYEIDYKQKYMCGAGLLTRLHHLILPPVVRRVRETNNHFP